MKTNKTSDFTSSIQALKEELIHSSVPLCASIVLGQAPKAQIYYEVNIDAKQKNSTKTILHRQTGLIPSESFTAILGPSGSGKTTFLNFLSSRLASPNLQITGEMRINSQKINSLELYSNQIGYVMQDDTLVGALTPRQCFRFAASLALNLNKRKTNIRVEQLIRDLGLTSCADVMVGNTFIKGISGGERKRTSIGVQLITNPGILFLDEPTTGLDSTTALQVIILLKNLASSGRTIISTIHQPSSELFCEFDRLMLLCDGHCIYHGLSASAQPYFKSMGYECPQQMNASQFYLDLMSIELENDGQQDIAYQQAKKKHTQKILSFEKKFLESDHHIIKQKQHLRPLQIKKGNEISIFYEMYLIMMRTFLCLVRNPMDVGLKMLQSAYIAVIIMLVYGQIQNEQIQNVRGVVYFMTVHNSHSGIMSTLAIFSNEKKVFLRQRYSKLYKTFSYFIGRTASDFPFDLLYPTFSLAIIYWVTGLGQGTLLQFAKLAMVLNSVYFCAASYGMLYSSIIPKLEVAMSSVNLLILPFSLLSGFYINLSETEDIRYIFYPIMYLSPFKYGFQGGMIAVNKIYEVYTPEGYWENVGLLLGLGVIARFFAFIAMRIISNPKRQTIKAIV